MSLFSNWIMKNKKNAIQTSFILAKSDRKFYYNKILLQWIDPGESKEFILIGKTSLYLEK